MRFVIVLATFVWLAMAGAAGAATLTVTTTSDSDDAACTASLCSLRDAVAYSSPGDVVVVPASSNHYVLPVYGEIVVQHPLAIQGAGASKTIIDAQSRSRVFEIAPTVGAGGTVSIKGVTITRGSVTGDGGGCIHSDPNSGNLVLTDVAVSNCSVLVTNDPDGRVGGGAIYAEGSDLTVSGSRLRGNSVIASSSGTGFNGGGAIFYYPRDGGTLSIADSDLSGNSATTNDNPGGVNGGGAILNIRGSMDIRRTTLIANSVTANRNQWNGAGNNGGGAILDDSGPTTLTDSTVSHNTVYADNSRNGRNGGGGILAQAGAWTIVRSTIADNTATVSDAQDEEGGGGISSTVNRSLTIISSTISGNVANLLHATGRNAGGGGILDHGSEPSTYVNTTIANNRTNIRAGRGNGGGGVHLDHDATFTNATVAGNSSSAAAGGGLRILGRARASVKSSILAQNTSRLGGNCYVDIVALALKGVNLVYGDDCTVDENPRTVVKNPRLTSLRDNGGPTETIAPRARSAAIDAIPLAGCTDQSAAPKRLTTDQRGFVRPDRRGARCDIGAVERSTPK